MNILKTFLTRSALVAALVLMLRFTLLSGQEVTPASLASKVDQHYNSLHSLRVHFIQEFNGLGQHRRETGTLLLKKPGRMRWTYDQPPGKLFVLDGRAAYFYTPGQNEVQRLPAKDLNDLRSPLRFLLGHSKLSRELVGAQVTRKGEDYELSGTPRSMEQRVSSLSFLLDARGTILRIQVAEADGSESIFSFSGEEANPEAGNAEFVFHPPPGVAIVDGPPPA